MLAGQLEPEDVHQFGDGRLGGHVMAAEHADPLQAESRFVEFHHDPTAPALRDVEDDQSPVDRLFEYADEPFAGRGVSCAEGFEHDAPESSAESIARRVRSSMPGKSLTTAIPPLRRAAMCRGSS